MPTYTQLVIPPIARLDVKSSRGDVRARNKVLSLQLCGVYIVRRFALLHTETLLRIEILCALMYTV